MISLIVCSRKNHIDPLLKSNIEASIGIPYEIICIDNSENRYSIFSAYNAGAEKAAYSHLCFMHDDILFHTQNWGAIVVEELSEPGTGVIGVAGSVYKSQYESSWWISNIKDFSYYHRYHLLQHFKTGVQELNARGAGDEKSNNRVVVLDGVWFCCRKELWQKYPFDEKNFKGFHFYDLDFSMKAFAEGFTNKVCYRIQIEHFSAGQMDKNWIAESKLFHSKWKNHLPASAAPITANERKEINKGIFRNYVYTLTSNGQLGFFNWISYWWKGFVRAPFEKENITLMVQYIKTCLKQIG